MGSSLEREAVATMDRGLLAKNHWRTDSLQRAAGNGWDASQKHHSGQQAQVSYKSGQTGAIKKVACPFSKKDQHDGKAAATLTVRPIG